MKTINNNARQGDISLKRVDFIPEEAKDICLFDKVRGGYTLALGEHTNHAHTMVAEPETKIDIKELEGKRYIRVTGGNAVLMHGTFTAPSKIDEKETDKHDSFVVTPGIYEQSFEIEYDPWIKKINQVKD
jgi:hypothetical protein